MGSCLIVANQTIGGAHLATAVTERIHAGKSQFHLMVPPQANPTATSGPVRATPQRSTAVGVTDGRKLAEQRLSYGLDWLTGLGATATGEIAADADTVAAVLATIGTLEIDEIIISTLPTTISRWIRQDLPSKIERHVDIPVTTISTRAHADTPQLTEP